MSTSKHPKTDRPNDRDLRGDPGIGRSKGGFAREDAPPLEGESTTEGDVGNDTTRQGGVDPNQRGRTIK
jgi:hypothetical protein